MKKLVAKLQNELLHLQKSVQKESRDVLKKLQKIALKENLESKRRDFEKLLEHKYKTFLPTCSRFANELRSMAKTVGIDLSRFEKSVQQTTGLVKKNLEKNKAKLVKSKGQIVKKIKQLTKTPSATANKAAKKKTSAVKTPVKTQSPAAKPKAQRPATSKANKAPPSTAIKNTGSTGN